MRTRLILIFIFIFAIVAGFFLFEKNTQEPGNKLTVVTTLFPLYDMAKNVGEGKAEVALLLPPGVEAHTFEPKPSDIVKINNADIFVYTGSEMEPWVGDILKSLDNQNLIVVDAGANTNKIQATFHDEDEPVGAIDPHIWLDFDNAKIMVDNITNAFVKKDFQDSDFYLKNSVDYKVKIDDLDKKFGSALSSCKTKTLVYGGHYAFGYLAKRYGLNYLSAQGVSPNSEPTAKDLINLVDQIKKNNIMYVFYEELSSPKIAQTISSETNAQMLLLNAGHNLSRDQFESGVSYFDILNSDLENLKIGLGCSR